MKPSSSSNTAILVGWVGLSVFSKFLSNHRSILTEGLILWKRHILQVVVLEHPWSAVLHQSFAIHEKQLFSFEDSVQEDWVSRIQKLVRTLLHPQLGRDFLETNRDTQSEVEKKLFDRIWHIWKFKKIKNTKQTNKQTKQTINNNNNNNKKAFSKVKKKTNK